MVLSRILPIFDSAKIGGLCQYFDFESFLWAGIILLVSRLLRNISDEIEGSWLVKSLFESLKSLMEILFGFTALWTRRDKMMNEISNRVGKRNKNQCFYWGYEVKKTVFLVSNSGLYI